MRHWFELKLTAHLVTTQSGRSALPFYSELRSHSLSTKIDSAWVRPSQALCKERPYFFYSAESAALLTSFAFIRPCPFRKIWRTEAVAVSWVSCKRPHCCTGAMLTPRSAAATFRRSSAVEGNVARRAWYLCFHFSLPSTTTQRSWQYWLLETIIYQLKAMAAVLVHSVVGLCTAKVNSGNITSYYFFLAKVCKYIIIRGNQTTS